MRISTVSEVILQSKMGLFTKVSKAAMRLLLSMMIVCYWMFAQAHAEDPGNTQITILRDDNGKPLPDAIVKVFQFDSLKVSDKGVVGFTNAAGIYRYTFTKPVVIQIAHLGFTTLTDTVYTAEERVYRIRIAAQNVQDVVITGQYSTDKPQNSVYSVAVVTNETIRAKGANNLREVLQNELNIDIGQDQVFGSSLGINGISGEGIKILVDGVPIVGRLDGKLDLSQININNIERIEIIKGPLSVVYGTDAMGGVINIITKAYQAQKINVRLKGYYESVGQYNVEADAGFSFKKSQLYVDAGRNFFDGFTTLDTIQRFKEWKPKEQYFADLKYMYTGNRLRVSLLGSFFRELMLDRSEPRLSISYDNADTSWTYLGQDYHYLTYRPRASAAVMYRFKEGYQLDVLAAYSGFIRFTDKYIKNLITLDEKPADASANDTARYHQALLRATYTMPAWQYHLNFLFGIEINNEWARQHRISGESKHAGDYAAFGSIRITPVKGLAIQPAVRIIYNTLFRAPLIPSLNIKYSYKELLTIRASYGKGYRAPSVKELYLEFFDSNHSLKGNPNLIPENGNSVIGAITYTQPIKRTHSIIFEVSSFYNDIKNKIDWKIIPGIGPVTDTFQYFNIKRYITYGGDASLTYKWKSFQIGVSGLLTRYELSNTTSGSDKVKMLSRDMTATARYKIPKAEIGISVIYKYNGAKPLFSVNNSIQAGTRRAYHSIDVSLTRNFWKDRIQLTIGGKNLANVTNVIADGVSAIGHTVNSNMVNVGWGRTFFTSLVFQFSK